MLFTLWNNTKLENKNVFDTKAQRSCIILHDFYLASFKVLKKMESGVNEAWVYN